MKQADIIEINGQSMTALEWARKAGITWRAAEDRFHVYGWPAERAVTEPKNSKSQAGRKGRRASSWDKARLYPSRRQREAR